MAFKAHVCDSNWRYCCIFHLESSFWQFVGVGKHNHLREWLQHSLYLRELALATDPPTQATLPSGHPSPSSAHASCCVHGGCWEDSGAVTYQCTLPCFNTEQMNGLHAISLKEEDSTAEGWGVGGAACERTERLELRGQSSIIHGGVNSCDRGLLPLSGTQTLDPVSVSSD